MEVVRKYDVDGIDFDRVRYPELNCGYDSATVELYRSEHNGSDPPTTFNNNSWIRWRADKLNEFMAAIYDSIKSESPEMHVSNAPLWYGYEQFCQDWPAWINNGWLDTVVPQLYYANNSTYQFRLNEELKKTGPDSLFHPGISTIANSVETPPGELIAMIETTRGENLPGHVIWYHARLDSYYVDLKNNVYQEKVLPPYRDETWRLDAIVINEDDTTVTRSDGWTEYTTLPGLDGKCFFSTVEDGDFIEYSANIKSSGWYEVYAFIVTQFNAHTDARYQLFSENGVDTVYVNQSIPGIRRWHKLADIYLNEGKQTVLRLDDEGLGTKVLFTDAIMLLNSNRANIEVTSIKKDESNLIYPVKTKLLPNYPNPFNPKTTLNYIINKNTHVELSIFNALGQKVNTLINGVQTAGKYKKTFNANNLSSGIYFVSLKTENSVSIQKIMLLK